VRVENTEEGKKIYYRFDKGEDFIIVDEI